MENSSKLTLQKSFFDDLWPLILKDNRCDTHSKNTSEFFIPARQFDSLWGHTYLAKKCYDGYQKPIELCCSSLLDEQQPDAHEESVNAHKHVGEEQNLAYCLGTPVINGLTDQIDVLRSAQERRQRLANQFVHRQYPWYMQLPSYETIAMDYTLRPLDISVLRNLHCFQCRLIIIDVASTVHLHAMEQWLKFCRYAKILAVVRDSIMARQLLLFDGAFYTLVVEENQQYTWQDELTHALDAGFAYARQLALLKHCAEMFIYVFASKRGLTSCDTFKVLRKF